MCYNGNLKAKKLNLDAIIVLLLANVDTLVWKPPTFFSVYTNRTQEIIKPNTVAGKTGYKWKPTDT
jgi:hypothetical protein